MTEKQGKENLLIVWLCEKQTLQGQGDMEGVLEEVLAVHSVIVCVCMCMWDPDELH